MSKYILTIGMLIPVILRAGTYSDTDTQYLYAFLILVLLAFFFKDFVIRIGLVSRLKVKIDGIKEQILEWLYRTLHVYSILG
ncbi:MAG: hypothetical protein KDC83_11725 [Flavobacteriales bacterium]|nr:hypothetical protein [Flavobacteriales bacterium]